MYILPPWFANPYADFVAERRPCKVSTENCRMAHMFHVPSSLCRATAVLFLQWFSDSSPNIDRNPKVFVARGKGGGSCVASRFNRSFFCFVVEPLLKLVYLCCPFWLNCLWVPHDVCVCVFSRVPFWDKEKHWEANHFGKPIPGIQD